MKKLWAASFNHVRAVYQNTLQANYHERNARVKSQWNAGLLK